MVKLDGSAFGNFVVDSVWQVWFIYFHGFETWSHLECRKFIGWFMSDKIIRRLHHRASWKNTGRKSSSLSRAKHWQHIIAVLIIGNMHRLCSTHSVLKPRKLFNNLILPCSKFQPRNLFWVKFCKTWPKFSHLVILKAMTRSLRHVWLVKSNAVCAQGV